MRVVLATHNAHKVEELRRILGPALAGIELVGYDGPTPVEDGDSFSANALIKARAAFAHTGLPAMADDSGVCVTALGGAPGIRSARYSESGEDADNVRLLLSNLAGHGDRSAYFECAAAFVGDGVEIVEVGTWPGSILDVPVGEGGFGYDPVFQPAGLSVSAAELRPEEKNAMSHRAIAFGRLVAAIRPLLPG